MSNTDESVVLIVEDQEGLAEAYSAVVSTEHTVRTAFGGEEALSKMDDAVDVVLLDRRMPGMSGDEVLAELGERGFQARTAMLTAVEPDVDILDMDFDGYVTKPIDNDELLTLVDSLIELETYSTAEREYYRIATKKKALASADRTTTDAYHSLQQRMQERRGEVDEAVESLVDATTFENPDPI